MSELARRAVACQHWRWMPGMRGVDSNADKWRNVSGAWIGEGHAIRTCRGQLLPDLTDPATLGCLLALVREAWRDETIGTAATREADGYRGWVIEAWNPLSPANEIGPFSTEAEALVAALEAAP